MSRLVVALMLFVVACDGSNADPSPTGDAADTTGTTLAGAATTTTAPTTEPPAPLEGLALETIAEDLGQPTVVASAPGDDRLFVAERIGRIRVIEDGNLVETSYLNLADRVQSNGIEQGLLGLTFHPTDETRLFVYYTGTEGRRTLSEFTIEGGIPDPDSEIELFSHPQPPDSVDIRHYGGHLMFGPEGYLYVSLGDGADARGQGQDPSTVFGTIVRLDVDSGRPYGIPADNPFVDGGGAPEVWVYGLRNPWRFSIDFEENLVYIADVGQEDWEEVNVLSLDEGGANMGWPSTEGNHCFLDPDCDLDEFVGPVLEYGHDEGCSITGGHVYRGGAIPELVGHYFYGDWCEGWVRSFRYADGSVTEEQDWSEDLNGAGQVNAFGLGPDGELYIANFEGQVLQIVPVR